MLYQNPETIGKSFDIFVERDAICRPFFEFFPIISEFQGNFRWHGDCNVIWREPFSFED